MVKLSIHVKPKSSHNEIILPSKTEEPFTVKVTAPAHDGDANAAVIRLLAQWAGVPKSSVTIVKGRTARYKVVEFATLDALP
jgi:uncharacterized protein (TIGR00251 family)